MSTTQWSLTKVLEITLTNTQREKMSLVPHSNCSLTLNNQSFSTALVPYSKPSLPIETQVYTATFSILSLISFAKIGIGRISKRWAEDGCKVPREAMIKAHSLFERVSSFFPSFPGVEATIIEPYPLDIEQIEKKWQWRPDSYGLAVELRPFVGEGDKELDYRFGLALKNECAIGSELYYEGMYWMHLSGYMQVEYPEAHESFIDFIDRYVERSPKDFYDYDGFRHVGSSIILAQSREAWEEFVNEKLTNIKISPKESYLIESNTQQIKKLLKKHQINVVHLRKSIETSNEGGFFIDTLSIHESGREIGKISIKENSFEIYETFQNSKLQPIIDFVEKVMSRTGTASAARSWLMQISDL